MVSTLRIIHIFAAAVWVGSVIFNFYLLRPALRLIPAAHAVVIAQRVGTLFTYTGWTALGLLVFSGVLRLHYNEDLAQIFTLELYTASSNPKLADVEKRRITQVEASLWLDRLNLINVITSTLALIAGASAVFGGLF